MRTTLPDAPASAPLDQILTGDCLSRMADWPDASVDLVFADPPYNIGYGYDQYDDNRSDDDYVQWTARWLDACVRLLKPTGSIFVLIGDEFAAETRLLFKQHEREGRLHFRNWIIWHYTFGQRCKTKFTRSHAHLFYAVGSAGPPTTEIADGEADPAPGVGSRFNYDAVAVPSARQLVYKDARANPKGKPPDDTWYLRPQVASDPKHGGSLFKPHEDTWYQSRLCGTFKERVRWHPCQLPEALLERIVKVATVPGDVVFDPFVGSGTTMVAARQLGRRWLGCELSPEYAKRARQRVRETACHGLDLP